MWHVQPYDSSCARRLWPNYNENAASPGWRCTKAAVAACCTYTVARVKQVTFCSCAANLYYPFLFYFLWLCLLPWQYFSVRLLGVGLPFRPRLTFMGAHARAFVPISLILFSHYGFFFREICTAAKLIYSFIYKMSLSYFWLHFTYFVAVRCVHLPLHRHIIKLFYWVTNVLIVALQWQLDKCT